MVEDWQRIWRRMQLYTTYCDMLDWKDEHHLGMSQMRNRQFTLRSWITVT